MGLTRRGFFSVAGTAVAGLAACSRSRSAEDPQLREDDPVEEGPAEPEVDLSEFEDLAIDMGAWSYDEANDCYYQLSLPYCIMPGSEQYESLSIFVPGAYLTGERHGSSWSCAIDEDARVGGYGPRTAPIALPVNSSSYAAQECPTSYSFEGLGRYLKAGIVYVYAGIRGRSGGYESATQEYFSGGAPWAVTDLKAAVRFLRYNAAVLPGDVSRVFAFGQGGAGGICASLGVSGGADPYGPYLQTIGAATHDVEGAEISDDIAGVAAWCPVGSFGSADAAYEWMMGQYDREGSRADGTWTQLLSADLAAAYGDFVNGLALTDGDGAALTLDRIEDGTFGGGSYYDHLVRLVSEAAEDFFRRTEFPFASLPLDARPRPFPGDPLLRNAGIAQAQAAEDGEEEAAAAPETGVRQIEATLYETRESYIGALNGDNRWLTYNASTATVDITGLWAFAAACLPPSREVCAYDLVDRSGLANQLFGTDDQPSMHFDAMVAKLVESQQQRYAAGEGWSDELVSEWRGDLAELDALEVSVADRVAMSDPLALLRSAQEQAVELHVAPHWRINTGLRQTDTTLVGEVNLALALGAREDVQDVAFQAVWEGGFGLAERAGDPEDCLVAWICDCCPEQESASADAGDDEAATSDGSEENS